MTNNETNGIKSTLSPSYECIECGDKIPGTPITVTIDGDKVCSMCMDKMEEELDYKNWINGVQ